MTKWNEIDRRLAELDTIESDIKDKSTVSEAKRLVACRNGLIASLNELCTSMIWEEDISDHDRISLSQVFPRNSTEFRKLVDEIKSCISDRSVVVAIDQAEVRLQVAQDNLNKLRQIFAVNNVGRDTFSEELKELCKLLADFNGDLKMILDTSSFRVADNLLEDTFHDKIDDRNDDDSNKAELFKQMPETISEDYPKKIPSQPDDQSDSAVIQPLRGLRCLSFETLVSNSRTVGIDDLLSVLKGDSNETASGFISFIRNLLGVQGSVIHRVDFPVVHIVLSWLDGGGQIDRFEQDSLKSPMSREWLPSFLMNHNQLTYDELGAWLGWERSQFRTILVKKGFVRGYRPNTIGSKNVEAAFWSRPEAIALCRRSLGGLWLHEAIEHTSDSATAAPFSLVKTAEPEIEEERAESQPLQNDPETNASTTLVETRESNPVESATISIEWQTGETASDVAKAIEAIGDRKCVSSEQFSKLLWHLTRERRFGAGYYLAAHLEANSIIGSNSLPPWLLKLLYYTIAMRTESGSQSQQLSQLLNECEGCMCISDMTNSAFREIHIAMIAALLRPAMWMPTSIASSLLSMLPPIARVPTYYEYRDTLLAFGQQLGINPNMLSTASRIEQWNAECRALQSKVERWRADRAGSKLTYAPATAVLVEWLKPDGLLFDIIAPVIEGSTNLELSLKLCDKWSRINLIDEEIKRTDSHRGRKGAPITATARAQLRNSVDSALAFLREWTVLLESRPKEFPEYIHQKYVALSTKLEQLTPVVLHELDELASAEESTVMEVATSLVKDALIDIMVSLQGERYQLSSIPLYRRFNYELLKCPHLALDSDWQPSVNVQSDLLRDELVHMIATTNATWELAFEARIGQDDYEAALWIVEWIQEIEGNEKKAQELREDLDLAIFSTREMIENEIREVEIEIEKATTRGYIPARLRDDLRSTTHQSKLMLSSSIRFNDRIRELASVRQEIQNARSTSVNAAREMLRVSGISSDNQVYVQIEAALQRGDVPLAHEYLQHALRGEKIERPSDGIDHFACFFPAVCQELTRDFEKQKQPLTSQSVITNVRRQKSFSGVNLNEISGAQAKQAADFLQAWFEIKQNRGTTSNERQLQQVLSRLGFDVLELTQEKSLSTSSRRSAWYRAQCEPIENRDVIPAAWFGSEARGRYRVLLRWERPSADDLVADVSSEAKGNAVIVLYFGRLTERQRRELAQSCRRGRVTFIVIDDLLAIYACGERGSRLSRIFQCALPFTHYLPYTSGHGFVSPEMFFGRDREKEIIKSALGAAFIYGGRQLGKTALLRHVEREFTNLERGHIAIWIDLKPKGIGFNHPLSEFWALIGQELHAHGIIGKAGRAIQSSKNLFDQVKQWLVEDENRRILLLLDETDRFFEADSCESPPFRYSSDLKALAEETKHRCKVVFAGLHNVQRTTSDANNPLLSLGKAICIGPLFEDGEWKEALALIRKPFQALGYRFEDEAVLWRLLAQTNYYPSLIQVVCSQIQGHMASIPVVVSEKDGVGPPFVIRERHVDEAYKDQGLRDLIRSRFNLTLRLDQRYQAIAYVIALENISDPVATLVKGVSGSWVREQVLYWWPSGFGSSNSLASIQALLDEMVGLGVLRRVAHGQFALRNPNVLTLMGTQEEIESALQDLALLEPSPEYEPATFRAGFPQDPAQRSPFTALEEARMAQESGVSIICGTPIAGLNSVHRYFALLHSRYECILAEDASDMSQFDSFLDRLFDRRGVGTTFVVVPNTCAWSERFVYRAIERTKKLASRERLVRFLFLVDSASLWQLLETSKQLDSFSVSGAEIVTLTKWDERAVRQWLHDVDALDNNPECTRILKRTTGFWPGLLYRLRSTLERNSELSQHDELGLDSRLWECIGQEEIYKDFGLVVPQAVDALRLLGEFGECTTEDLLELADEIEVQATLTKSLHWGRLLGLIEKRVDKWQIDPIVQRVLRDKV